MTAPIGFELRFFGLQHGVFVENPGLSIGKDKIKSQPPLLARANVNRRERA
jgi:hypothetical protein